MLSVIFRLVVALSTWETLDAFVVLLRMTREVGNLDQNLFGFLSNRSYNRLVAEELWWTCGGD